MSLAIVCIITRDLKCIASDTYIFYKIQVLMMQRLKVANSNGGRFFTLRAASALGISIIADALDYIVAPVFDMPIIGDVFDFFTNSLLYSLTRSKTSAAINLIEFIPFVGDFIPVYTISTLLWIYSESKKHKKIEQIAY
jgi:hypothetical protein